MWFFCRIVPFLSSNCFLFQNTKSHRIFSHTEVVADDTRAIDAVVNADKKRLALLAEKDNLESEAEKEGVDNTDRLKEVCT